VRSANSGIDESLVPEGALYATARRLSRRYRTPGRGPADAEVREQDEGLTVLRGPDIRREAVCVLLAHPGHPEAMHYRDWYGLLQEAGFAAGGKDPLATFLTQLSRSPAVRKSTQAGVYELDRDAVRRLRRRRDEVQQELRALTARQTHGAEGAAVRARRTELNADLGRVEKALEEVEVRLEAAGEPVAA
jgi:hypothetical protein